jgi:hypothetical protein
MFKRALTVLVFLLSGAPLYAQTLGTITGDVKDSSGATIPVRPSRRRTSHQRARTQASNEVGAFTFPAMPPGVYVVKAELDGSSRRRIRSSCTWSRRCA